MEKLNRPPFVNYDPREWPSVDEFDTVELKYDGWWGQVLIEGSRWELWSRSGQLKKFGELNGELSRSLLHGEFLFGTEWAKDRPDLYGRVAIFDAVELVGQSCVDFPLSKRRARIEQFLEKVQPHLDLQMFLIDQFPVEVVSDVWDQYVVEERFEGLIFKNSRMHWGDKMGRMKADTTMDYVCLGFEESESETYEGWGVACIVGGLFIDGAVVRTCKVSGLTNDWRKEFFDNPDKYVGRVFEAEGKRVTKKGALRHPNFMRWRDDKSAEDCKWPLTSPKIKS